MRKTRSIDRSAYEKLRSERKNGVSFSDVKHRAVFEEPLMTAGRLREYLSAGGSGVPEQYLKSLEEVDSLRIAPRTHPGCAEEKSRDREGSG